MVTGACYVDLSTEPTDVFDNRDRRELAALEFVPDGARLVVFVGARRWVTDDAARWLHNQSDRLLIEVQGSPNGDVRRWVEAIRTGKVGVIL